MFLKTKYVFNLLVNDEGGYWESRDRRLLAEKRILLDQYIRDVEKVISSVEVSEEDRQDPDRLASRIEGALLKDEEEQSDE